MQGKEGYPTIAYEVVCDHTLRIMSCTRGHYGSRNDKTIVRFDGFISALRNKQIFGDISYELKKAVVREDGVPIVIFVTVVGPYVIYDGGYHKWRVMQEPLKHAVDYIQVRWSKWVESVRKDIERVFGIMKKRFIILKHGTEYNTQSKCDYVFLACCMLHNVYQRHNCFPVSFLGKVGFFFRGGAE